MSAYLSQMASIGFFVVVGWAALWPVRRVLGPAGYHAAALPFGLLAPLLAGVFSSLSGRPLDGIATVIGALALVAVMHALFKSLGSTPQWKPERADARSMLLGACLWTAASALFALTRLTVTNNDSVMAYWPRGVELTRTGMFTGSTIATRSALLPAMNAVHVVFGSDWAYAIYPAMALSVLMWLWISFTEGSLRTSARRTATGIAAIAAVFLAIEPSFIFHSFMAHSQMVSALYLLIALTAVWKVALPDRPGGSSDLTWLVIAGSATAGFAHARPDGLAYMFVPIAVAIGVITRDRVDRRAVAAFFIPLVLLVGSVYGATYATQGLWDSTKLSGSITLAILAVLLFAVVSPWVLQALDRILPFRVSGERFMGTLVVAALAGTAIIFALKWETASGALLNAGTNLFGGAGGYSYLWYGVVAALILSFVSGDALRPGSWTRASFLGMALFFVIVALVHGVSHEGRLGVGDSMNRVVFHALPLVIFHVGSVVGRVLSQRGSNASARTEETKA